MQALIDQTVDQLLSNAGGAALSGAGAGALRDVADRTMDGLAVLRLDGI
jgi:hypothetical protein